MGETRWRKGVTEFRRATRSRKTDDKTYAGHDMRSAQGRTKPAIPRHQGMQVIHFRTAASLRWGIVVIVSSEAMVAAGSVRVAFSSCHSSV